MSDDQQASAVTIGVVGLGNMGRGIARSFIQAGHRVQVWDVSEAARGPFGDDAEFARPSDMARTCTMIVFVVPGSKEIDAMMAGPDDLLAGARAGLAIYDFTTSDPAYTRRLADRAAEKGVVYMDAGMTGGAQHAEDGTLSLMIGGDEETLRRTTPLLKACARKLLYLGPSGAGHTMKLIHNLTTHTNFLAVCEAAHLARRAGIEVSDMIEVFNHGNARSFISERRFPDHILSGAFDGRSRVYNLHKDIGMVVRMADDLGATINIGRDVYAYLEAAIDRSMSEEDFTRLYTEFEALADR